MRAHFNAIVERLLEKISSFDPSIRGIGVNDCTYRIYKDMRFSRDGLPYKTHFGAFIARSWPCPLNHNDLQSYMAGSAASSASCRDSPRASATP